MGPLCDILWSDPVENYDSFDHEDGFLLNQQRGCSYCYTYSGVVEFLNRNRLLSVIRAHEAQDTGYRMHKKTHKGFPSVITLFSAPNYLDAYGNKGAILRYENGVLNIKQFSHSYHPYWLPSFVDVITWSMPFVSEKVGEILLALLKCVDSKEDEEEELKEELRMEEENRKKALESKIESISKIVNMYSKVRKQREHSMQLGALAPSGMDVPKRMDDSVVRYGSEPILYKKERFFDVKKIDQANEKRPPMPKDFVPKSSSFPSLLLRSRKREDD